MTVVTPKFGMGASVLRREDAAFIQGQGHRAATSARIRATIQEAEAK